MKKLLLSSMLFISLVFWAGFSFAQCTPLPLTDPEGNGEMSPDTLYAIELIPMNDTLSIIAPATATIPPFGSLGLQKIVLKSITNKPVWLLYACNPANCEYIAGQLQCALVTGTPPAGVDTVLMDVLVDVYATGLGLIASNYNSGNKLVLIILPSGAGTQEIIDNNFSLIQNQPNPFKDKTHIGCRTSIQETVTLSVVDMLGNNVHTEKMTAKAGDNYFNFDGSALRNGVYYYSVIYNQNQVVTRKMVKID